MNFWKTLLGKKDKTTVADNDSFWNWFMLNEKLFYTVLKNEDNVDG